MAQNEEPPAANPAPENPTHTRDASSTARIENAAGAPAGAIGSRAPERYQVIGEHGRGGLGRVSRAHDRELGRGDYTRAVALMEQLRGANADQLIWLLVGQARCLILSGHSGDAIAPLERALKLPAAPEDALDVVRAQYYLGRAHVETRRHVAGGIAMVRAARVTLAADADFRNTELAREIDTWLAARR